MHSLNPHRGHNGLDAPGIRTLGEVGNALYDRTAHDSVLKLSALSFQLSAFSSELIADD
jgi:hypothetical protein